MPKYSNALLKVDTTWEIHRLSRVECGNKDQIKPLCRRNDNFAAMISGSSLTLGNDALHMSAGFVQIANGTARPRRQPVIGKQFDTLQIANQCRARQARRFCR